MRDAWPSVAGRICESRSTISRESPGMPAKTKSVGDRAAFLPALAVDREFLTPEVALGT